MHKTISLLVLLGLFSFSIIGQNLNERKNNVHFGGNFSMGFGSNYSSFSISPSAIYDLSNQFSAGLSFTYIYIKHKNTTYKSNTNLVGGSVLALYRPIEYLQLSSEYEQLKINQKYNFENEFNDWQNALYFGIEYVSGNIAIGLRYDVLFDENKNFVYASALNPVFRVYF
jgi:hypothetical protein